MNIGSIEKIKSCITEIRSTENTKIWKFLGIFGEVESTKTKELNSYREYLEKQINKFEYKEIESIVDLLKKDEDTKLNLLEFSLEGYDFPTDPFQKEDDLNRFLYFLSSENIDDYLNNKTTFHNFIENKNTNLIPGKELSSKYNRFNKMLTSYFYDRKNINRKVYLNFDKNNQKELKLLFPEFNFDEYVKSIKENCNYEKLRLIFNNFVGKDDNYPKCVGLLVFFSIAAEKMQSKKNFGDNERSSTNFYDPLCELLDINPKDSKARRDVGYAYRSVIENFWNELIECLDKNENLYGKPSVKELLGKKNRESYYVNFSRIQALFNNEDKKRIISCFIKFRLNPSQSISHNDMIGILNEWIPNSNLQKILISLYESDEDMKKEIVEEAMDVLRNWNGEEILDEKSVSTNKLQKIKISIRPEYTKSLLSRSLSKLHLSLLVPNNLFLEDKKFYLENNEALYFMINEIENDSYSRLNLSNEESLLWEFIDNKNSQIFISKESEYKLHIEKKGSYIFTTNENSTNRFIDAQSLSLNQKSYILSNENEKEIDKFLGNYCEPVFKKYTHNELIAIPESFVFYTNIYLKKLPDSNNKSPISITTTNNTTSNINFEDGFLLERDTFHINNMGKVKVNSQKKYNIRIINNGKNICKKENLINSFEIDLSKLNMTIPSLRIELFTETEIIDKRDITLINNKSTRRNARIKIFREFNNGKELLQSIPFGDLEKQKNSITLEGAFSSNLNQLDVIDDFSFSLRGHTYQNLREIQNRKYKIYEEFINVGGNVEHFRYNPKPDSIEDLRERLKKLKDNNILKFIPYSSVYRDYQVQKKKNISDLRIKKTDKYSVVEYSDDIQNNIQNIISSINEVDKVQEIDESYESNNLGETVLESLSYMGSGSLEKIRDLCPNSIRDSYYFYFKNLSFLGHIELTDNNWSICPATYILSNKRDSIYIAGRRTYEDIQSFREVSNKLDYKVYEEAHNNLYPKWIGIKNLNEKDIEKFKEYANLEEGLPLRILSNIKKLSIDNYLSNSKILAYENYLQINEECHIYELNEGWKLTEFENKIGAYRDNRNYNHKYFFFDGKKFILHNPQNVKFMLAREKKVILSEYIEENNVFRIRRINNLPEIIAKTLVLCSGFLPKEQNNNNNIFLEYKNINKDINKTVLEKIYG